MVLVFLLLLPAAAVRSNLESARTALDRGRAALSSGDFSTADRAFVDARQAFLRARSDLGNPLIKLGSFLPFLGRIPDAATAVSEAGLQVAEAARLIASAVEDLSGGEASLLPSGGTFPLERFAELAGPLRDSVDLLAAAEGTIVRSPGSLLGPFAGIRDRFLEQLTDARRVIELASALVEDLPEFLGAKGMRRYFLGAQNPSELRGTGGFIGAYSILTAHSGRIRLTPFSPIQQLPSVHPSEIEPPNPSFAARYDQFGGAGFWPNINLTPDAPSAAVAIERLYRKVTGDRLDGVILTDPIALALLLQATGPVQVPSADITVDARSIVPFLTIQAFVEIEDPVTRKRISGEVARAALDAFLDGTVADPAEAARVLVQAAAGSHIVLHSTDEEVQRTFEEAGIAGALQSPEGDFLAVVGNNAATNKADIYARREIKYRISLEADGAGRSVTSVVLENEAPAPGEAGFVPELYAGPSRGGENATRLSVFCTWSCQLQDVQENGESASVVWEEELGHQVFTKVVELPRHTSKTLELAWDSLDVWDEGDEAGHYELVVQSQTTIQPTRLSVEIQVPDGMQVTATSPPMTIEGDRATWTGIAADVLRFRVDFERRFLSI